MAYSKAYLSSPTGGDVRYFDDIRDYAVLASTCRRQALQVDSAYVSLDQHNLHLTKGATAQLAAKLIAGNPRKSATITFVSSNPGVATVDQTGKAAWNTYFNNANAFKKINDALDKLSAVGVDKLPESTLIWTANEGDDNGTTAAALLVNSNGLKFMPVSKTVSKGENNEESLVRTFFAF
jgi:hypothetical protein